MRTAKKFKTKPVFTIVQISIFPVAMTIELGAVAAGSIKAQLAASVTGNMSRDGSIPIVFASGISIGSTSAVEDMFDVNSVTKLMPTARKLIVVR